MPESSYHHQYHRLHLTLHTPVSVAQMLLPWFPYGFTTPCGYRTFPTSEYAWQQQSQ